MHVFLRKIAWRYAVFREARSFDKLLLPMLTLPFVRGRPCIRRILRERISQMNGLRLRLLDSESIAIFSSMFEPFMRYWFKPQLGQTVLDIGAHAGKYTLEASRAVGSTGTVVAVEAHPENYSALAENLRLNDAENVRAVECAIWKENSSLGLFVGKLSGLHSVRVDHGHGVIQVQGRTVDDLVEELGVSCVDWMKIDVEGAEIEALEGARKTIVSFKPKIIVEVRQFQTPTIKAIAEKHGYGIIEIQSPTGSDWLSSGYWYLAPLGLPRCQPNPEPRLASTL